MIDRYAFRDKQIILFCTCFCGVALYEGAIDGYVECVSWYCRSGTVDDVFLAELRAAALPFRRMPAPPQPAPSRGRAGLPPWQTMQ